LLGPADYVRTLLSQFFCDRVVPSTLAFGSLNHELKLGNVSFPQILRTYDVSSRPSCGHVGCCDQSPRRHARGHFEATGHPIIEGYDPPEGWGWCYIDDIEVELPNKAPHIGPIPRFI
jgi:Zn-finger in ubiquitin-hydrolases and other protein